MCGIIGVIGQSKDPERSYNLITSLFKFSQIRGLHASGFYCIDSENKCWTYKDSIPSVKFVKTEPWKKIKDINYKVLLAHARYAAIGDPRDDFNNHPIVSKTGNVALVYNGRFDDFPREERNKYTKRGNDAVLIHRIILKENNISAGIKKLYESYGKYGTFACSIAYRDEDKSYLYFFRDEKRPLVVIDASKELGQYIIVSEESIWKSAINDLGENLSFRLKEVEPFKSIKISEDFKLEVEHIGKEVIEDILSSRKEKDKEELDFKEDKENNVNTWSKKKKVAFKSRLYFIECSEEDFNNLSADMYSGNVIVKDHILLIARCNLPINDGKYKAFGYETESEEEMNYLLGIYNKYKEKRLAQQK